MATRPIEDIYPLSPTQRGLLFHSLHEPELSVYYQSISIPYTELDIGMWRAAWTLVVGRHSALRTAFVWENREEPLQVVLRAPKLAWADLDWRAASDEDRRGRLQEYLRSDRHLGFDVGKAPPMRFAVIRMTDRDYRFIWSSHHILFDGWSMVLVFREVSAVYDAMVGGETVSLSPGRPYGDYIAWLRRQDRSAAEAFWRQALVGLSAPTPILSRSAPGDVGEGEPFREIQVRLSRADSAALRAVARRHRVTIGVLVQGAWALLLSRYAGQSDVLFGVMVFGRPPELAGSEAMVGLFVNALPMRVFVDENRSLLEWLAGLQARQASMRQFEHCSLLEVQGWSDIPRGAPMFDSLLSLGFGPEQGPEQILELEEMEIDTFQRAHYPLTIRSIQSPDLLLGVAYDRRRFGDDAISRAADHLGNLLKGMADDPDGRVRDLSQFGQAERRQLLVDWNRTAGAVTPRGPLMDLFAEQVAARPHAPAVAFGDEVHTYGEVDRRAGRLARRLRARGVKDGDLVAICLERGIPAVEATVAVVKAGATYLPLDDAWPSDRLAAILDDAAPRLVVTERWRAAALGVAPDRLLALDDDRSTAGEGQGSELPARATGSSIACILYAAGTSGVGRGVVIPQHAIASLVRGTPMIQVEQDECVAYVSSPSSDIAMFEIWGALLNGARLAVAGAASLEPDRLAPLIRAHGVTTLFVTTQAFNLIGQERPSMFAPLRRLVFGGEGVDPHAVRRVLEEGRPGLLLHAYGPAEDAAVATVHAVQHVGEEDLDVPIGRPIANTAVLVLDRFLRPVPVGVVGELYLGGGRLAYGYLREPRWTAERFIPDPFESGGRGGRLYRTGDLAVWSRDGIVHRIGRAADQVALRGLRVDPHQLELVLRRHGGVKDAVVVAVDDSAGKRLVAYVVPADDAAELAGELDALLASTLPAWAASTSLVFLEALPLGPDGRVNVSALVAAELTARGEEYIAPRTATERMLADIWQEVLDVDRVGVRDNFFELGGHSLLAMRVATRIARVCRIEIPMRVVLEELTVESLAARVEKISGPGDGGAAADRQGDGSNPISPLVRLRPGGARPPLFFVHPVGGSVLAYQALSRRLHAEQPFHAIQSPMLVDETADPGVDLSGVAASYVAMMRSAQPAGPYRLGGWSLGGVIAFEMARQLERLGEQVAALVLIDSYLPDEWTRKISEVDIAAGFAMDLLGHAPAAEELRLDRLADMSADERLDWIRDTALSLDLLDPDMTVARFRRFFETYRSNVLMYARYQPGSYGGGMLHLFRAREQAARVESTGLDSNRWPHFSSRGVAVIDLPGSHYSILHEPIVAQLADELNGILGRQIGALPTALAAPALLSRREASHE